MASPVDTSVKFYRDDFPGAPVLSGTAGAAIAVLDACLVNGFGLRTATSLVVSGGVATMMLPSNASNPNLVDSVVLVDGVTGALTALNGEQRVTGATATTLTFATAAADGTATGTITVKTAAAGWAKAHFGTNKAAYRSLDAAGSQLYFRVDDSSTTDMLVRGFETMSDVDAGTGPFPTLVEASPAGYWSKSQSAGAGANKWDLFADSRAFIFSPLAGYSQSDTYAGQASYFFGDLVSFKSVDPYACAITWAASPPNSATAGSLHHINTTNHNLRFARSYVGTGSAVQGFTYPSCGASSATGISGVDALYGAFPTVTDGGLRLARLNFLQGAQTGSNVVLRGTAPGYLWAPQNSLESFRRGDRVNATGDLGGRKLYCVSTTANFSDQATAAGRSFIDITGPWR